MLKGDLTSTPLAPLLRDLADDNATGCLHVTNPAGDEALIYFKTGLVYSATVPGTRPQLGAKLVSSGALAPEALAEALEAQRSELQGWRLGELLVHLGYVDQPVVEAFVREQVNEALWDLLRWVDGRWKFRKNIRAREDIGPPMVVVELLATLRDRGYEWENISAVVHGPSAVPVLSARGGGSAETTLDNDAWSMLCKIDGERSVADLARDCGYTLFEAGQVMVQLVQAGLVDMEEDVEIAGAELYGASTLTSALAGELDDDSDETAESDDGLAGGGEGRPTDAEKEDVLSRLARLVNEVAGDHSQDAPGNGGRPGADLDDLHALEYEPASSVPAVALAPPLQSGVTSFENPMIVPLHRHSSESFAASIARVSDALSDVLGTTPEAAEAEAANSPKPVALKRSRGSSSDPEWQRRKRLRSAAAAELASAQAMVETLRAETEGVDTPVTPVEATAEQADEPAVEEVVEELAAEQTDSQESSDEQAEAERTAAEEAQAEAERIAAEQAEAERIAAEEAQAEAERLAAEAAEVAAIEAAERAALEDQAWADYWQREGEERAGAEAERIAAEQAEAERIAAEEAEAERIAAEEAEQRAAAEAEAERIAAEEAEAERIAAEQAEAERIAAEQAEAERLAAEAEAERLAAEQAELERLEAEEAERLAAEQAEAERLAAEAEAERIAAEEAEAERIAAEQAEAERIAAEQAEIERIEAEEAERQAAEQAEADRIAAEEAEQQAAAAAEAERIEAEEAERQAAELAEADRIAAEEKVGRAVRRRAEREEAEELARQRDEAAAATAMLIELAASSQAEAAAAEPVEAAQEEVAAESTPEEPEPDTNEAWSEAGQADTAALLRELSSLGMDDDEPSAPTQQQQRPRQNTADKKTKKKIGLFGL